MKENGCKKSEKLSIYYPLTHERAFVANLRRAFPKSKIKREGDVFVSAETKSGRSSVKITMSPGADVCYVTGFVSEHCLRNLGLERLINSCEFYRKDLHP